MPRPFPPNRISTPITTLNEYLFVQEIIKEEAKKASSFSTETVSKTEYILVIDFSKNIDGDGIIYSLYDGTEWIEINPIGFVEYFTSYKSHLISIDYKENCIIHKFVKYDHKSPA